MQIIVDQTTIIGGRHYQCSHLPQEIQDDHARHLIDIGNAQQYETKVVEPAVKKSPPASQEAPASRAKTAKPSGGAGKRGRSRKSSSSTTATD